METRLELRNGHYRNWNESTMWRWRRQLCSRAKYRPRMPWQKMCSDSRMNCEVKHEHVFVFLAHHPGYSTRIWMATNILPPTCKNTLFTDANVELAVMKSNQAANTSTASLSSYAGSTSSLTGGNRSQVIGSHEAMPSIRARLAKNGARPTPTRAVGANGLTTPHQNPVKMVQEMVGRVKVCLSVGKVH